MLHPSKPTRPAVCGIESLPLLQLKKSARYKVILHVHAGESMSVGVKARLGEGMTG